jgi:adenine-specific DNA-methyltransferase
METLSQMMLETPNLNQERLDKLKELFPDLFTGEGKLNEDELKKLTAADGTVKETERYDFRWFGKSQAKRNAFTPTNTTLVSGFVVCFTPSIIAPVFSQYGRFSSV